MFDYGLGVALGEDDSLIISGSTSGSWYAPNEGSFDVVVMKLDRDGNRLWGWQVRHSQRRVYSWAFLSPDSHMDVMTRKDHQVYVVHGLLFSWNFSVYLASPHF